jgi:hypothetical protein
LNVLTPKRRNDSEQMRRRMKHFLNRSSSPKKLMIAKSRGIPEGKRRIKEAISFKVYQSWLGLEERSPEWRPVIWKRVVSDHEW